MQSLREPRGALKARIEVYKGRPLLVLLAGPNGAGKSTFREAFLKDLALPFVNADILASDFNMGAYEAAELAAEMRSNFVRDGRSFIAETVFSDPVGDKVNFLSNASEKGFDVVLIFVGLSDPEHSRRRVSARVQAGGHDVPTDKLMARYERTLDNLERAIPRLPRIVIYDNSSYREPYRLLGEFRSGEWRPAANAPKVAWFGRFSGRCGGAQE